jgi:hypothetical protein
LSWNHFAHAWLPPKSAQVQVFCPGTFQAGSENWAPAVGVRVGVALGADVAVAVGPAAAVRVEVRVGVGVGGALARKGRNRPAELGPVPTADVRGWAGANATPTGVRVARVAATKVIATRHIARLAARPLAGTVTWRDGAGPPAGIGGGPVSAELRARADHLPDGAEP